MHKMWESCIRSRVGKSYQDVNLEREVGIHWCIGTWSWQQVSQALFEMHRMWQVVELDQYGGQGL